jgi:hypothetical protein
MGSNNEYHKETGGENDVELKGDLELDFNDESSPPSEEPASSITPNTFDIGPTTSKTVGSVTKEVV